MTAEEFIRIFSALVLNFLHYYEEQHFLRSGPNKLRTSAVSPTVHDCCCECAYCPGPLVQDEEGNRIGCIPKYNEEKTKCPKPTERELLSAIFYVYLQAQTGVFDKTTLDKRSRWLVSQAKELVSHIDIVSIRNFHPSLLKDLVYYVSYNDTVLYRKLFPQPVYTTKCGRRLESIITNRERVFEQLQEYLIFLPKEVVDLVLIY